MYVQGLFISINTQTDTHTQIHTHPHTHTHTHTHTTNTTHTEPFSRYVGPQQGSVRKTSAKMNYTSFSFSFFLVSTDSKESQYPDCTLA